MGFLSRKQTQPARAPEIWEHNEHFGQPFNMAVQMCDTPEELTKLIEGYKLSTKELDRFEERLELLYAAEDLAAYESEATKKAQEIIARIHGRDHPEFDQLVANKVKGEVDLEQSIREGVSAAAKAERRRMEHEDERHRELISSIERVADTVEESSAYAQTKSLVDRHPFLTGLLGPSVIKKLFGR